MPHNADEIALARQAIGRTQTAEEVLDTESLRRFAVAIGCDDDVETAMPTLAHWAWFLPAPGDGAIGADGHLECGGFLPALPSFPRRMFASTAITFEAPLELDARAQMTSTVVDVRHKGGRSGDLVFVEVEKTIAQHDLVRIIECQTSVYRTLAEGGALLLPQPEPISGTDLSGGQVWTPGTVHLFRFSAVTFNAHRIHYDLPYARDVEGYPALIVHGPFIAAKLAEYAARAASLATFAFRAQAPSFVDQPLRLVSAGDGALKAVRCDGAVATTATVTYRDASQSR